MITVILFAPSVSRGFQFLETNFHTTCPKKTSHLRTSNDTVVDKNGEKTEIFDQ